MSTGGESGGGSGGGRKSRLGRGLSSLLGDDESEERQLDRFRQTRNIPVDRIEPGRYQPRQRFDEAELRELADSIREKGVLQPILLRRGDDPDSFQIIAGERRWRAAQLAQLHEIPALVRDFDDDEALEIALIENLQREDLTPLEEAEAYRRLIDEHGQTQDSVARAVSKSRSHVANAVRLLGLPDPVKAHLEAGALSAGHARALLGADDPVALAEQVVRKGLTVRDTERLVQRAKQADDTTEQAGGIAPTSGPGRRPANKDPDTLALEHDLAQAIGLTVEIRADAGESGSLTLYYQSLDQLDDLLERLTRPIDSRPAFAEAPDETDPAGEWPENTVGEDGQAPDEDVDFSELLAQTEALLAPGTNGQDGDEVREGAASADSADGDIDFIDAIPDTTPDADDSTPAGQGTEGPDEAAEDERPDAPPRG